MIVEKCGFDISVNTILEQRKGMILQAKNLLGDNFLKDDLYFFSVIDRSIRLSDGFIEMIKSRNLMCSGIILRSLLDNIMRLVAYMIAHDKEELVQIFLSDEKKISTLKDINGKRMSDYYLKKKMKIIDDRFEGVYDAASGYVHHTGKSLFSISTALEGHKMEVTVGGDLPLRNNLLLQECADAFIHYLLLQKDLFDHLVHKKMEFDTNCTICEEVLQNE